MLQTFTFEKGKTSQSLYFTVQKSTDGTAFTGLLYNTASLTCYYKRGATDAATAITLATLASETAAWSSGGLILISDTSFEGTYRFDIPDAVLATGVDLASIVFRGATDMHPSTLSISLVEPVTIVSGVVAASLPSATQASIDAIEVDTGTTLQAELDAIQAAVITNAAGADVAADIIALKTVADAIKVPTDKMVFTNTNELDVNTKSINDAEVVGDGNATPWDGV